ERILVSRVDEEGVSGQGAVPEGPGLGFEHGGECVARLIAVEHGCGAAEVRLFLAGKMLNHAVKERPASAEVVRHRTARQTRCRIAACMRQCPKALLTENAESGVEC